METNADNISKWIESLLKLSGLLGGVLYLTGFTISTLHFTTYGLLSVDFISAQYIIIGTVFWLVVFMSLAIIPLLYLAKVFESKASLPHNLDVIITTLLKSVVSNLQINKIKNILARIGNTFVALYLWCVGSFIVMSVLFYNINVDEFFELVNGYAIMSGIFTAFFILITFVKPFGMKGKVQNKFLIKPMPVKKTSLRDYFRSAAVILAAVVLVFYQYQIHIYRYLPAKYGGGFEKSISLQIRKNELPKEVAQSFSYVDSTSFFTKEYSLVKESQEGYYIIKDKKIKELYFVPKSVTYGIVTIDKIPDFTLYEKANMWLTNRGLPKIL